MSQDLQLDLLTLRTAELSEGGQRDDCVGDGVHRVSHTGLIGGTAGLDAADSVCFLLAETAGKQPREVDGKAGTTALMGKSSLVQVAGGPEAVLSVPNSGLCGSTMVYESVHGPSYEMGHNLT